MSIKNVLALAAALLTSSALSANAQGLGASVQVGPLGAGLGIGGTVLQQPAVLGGQFIDNNLLLNQAAVINGGVTAEGLMTGGNLLGITRLPQGTQLVQGPPFGGPAIILPGMVGMPSLSGCGVSTIGPIGPSALSLIGTSNFVASLPVGGVTQRTFTRVTKTTRITTVKPIHKRVLRKCSHKRVIRREILK